MSIEDLKTVRDEIREIGLDLEAFHKARNIIRARVIEVKDQVRQLTPLINWSGTECVLGGLDLSIHAMERTLEELKQIEKAMSHDRKFRVVEGDGDGSKG